MKEKFGIGSHVFIIESNQAIKEMVVASNHGDFYVLKFLTGGAIQLRSHRIFKTMEEAQKRLPKNKYVDVSYYNSPYYYGS